MIEQKFKIVGEKKAPAPRYNGPIKCLYETVEGLGGVASKREIIKYAPASAPDGKDFTMKQLVDGLGNAVNRGYLTRNADVYQIAKLDHWTARQRALKDRENELKQQRDLDQQPPKPSDEELANTLKTFSGAQWVPPAKSVEPQNITVEVKQDNAVLILVGVVSDLWLCCDCCSAGMNFILSTSQAQELFKTMGWPWEPGYFAAEVTPKGKVSSGKQRRGWHWLLDQWLQMDPGVAENKEALKTRLLILMWGAAKVTDRHGNETLIALRRTTQFWDWDMTPPGYRKKKLSKALYTELVEYTYDMAAKDDILLPEMLPEFADELEQPRRAA